VTWRVGAGDDCSRLGPAHTCFCGHSFNEHACIIGKNNFKCLTSDCKCGGFNFVPTVPEEVGEWWLNVDGTRKAAKPKVRLSTSSASATSSVSGSGSIPPVWRAKCKCQHDHLAHGPTGDRRCRSGNCRCGRFESAYRCVVCDKSGHEHDTVFETEAERRASKRSFGVAYRPLSQLVDMGIAMPPSLCALQDPDPDSTAPEPLASMRMAIGVLPGSQSSGIQSQRGIQLRAPPPPAEMVVRSSLTRLPQDPVPKPR
jgi:hypothetical protein